MTASDNNENSLVKKLVLLPGTGEIPYPDGTKVQFHVKSEALLSETLPPWPPSAPLSQAPEYEGKLIDDSHAWKQPVELLLGKKFKMEVWEECLNTMRKGEEAMFFIDKKLVSSYPIVSQTLRKAYNKGAVPAKKKEEEGHRCCGMGAKEGLGHKDLDDLLANPRHMKFRMELVSVELPGSYEKQYWEMSEEERLQSVPQLQEEGNALYKAGQHARARDKYREAIGRLENLMLREKPNDTEWLAFNAQKMPLLLNFTQCQLIEGEYYGAVEHCSTVLEHQPDNVKALFRRGKAYVELCEGDSARQDLERCCKLDPSTATSCRKLLAKLAATEKKHHDRDKKVYGKLFGAAKEAQSGKEGTASVAEDGDK